MDTVDRSLRTAYFQPDDAGARSDMSLGSLFSGLALANAGLGAVHGIAGPWGACATPPTRDLCKTAADCREDQRAGLEESRADIGGPGPVSRGIPLVDRFPNRNPTDGIAWLNELVKDLQIPPLCDYGLQPSHTARLVPQAQKARAACRPIRFL